MLVVTHLQLLATTTATTGSRRHGGSRGQSCLANLRAAGRVTTLALVLASLLTTGGRCLCASGALPWCATPRAQACATPRGRRGAARAATSWRTALPCKPALGVAHAVLLVAAAIPAAWALSILLSGWALALCLVGPAWCWCWWATSGPLDGAGPPRFPAYHLSGLLAAAVRAGSRPPTLLAVRRRRGGGGGRNRGRRAEEIKLITSVLEFGDAVVRRGHGSPHDMVTISARDDTDSSRRGDRPGRLPDPCVRELAR